MANVAQDTLPSGFLPAGNGVDITTSASMLSNPLLLKLPGEAPAPEHEPIILHKNHAGHWEIEPAIYQDSSYQAYVSSFSLRIPGYLNPKNWLDSGFDWLSGRTDPPTDCEGETYPWVAFAGPPADGSFHACVKKNPKEDGTERIEVKITSNRSMAMWITVPTTPADYLWIEGLTDWTLIAPVITEIDQAFGPDRILLPPGRSLTLGYTRPIGSGPSLDFSSYQNNTTQVVSLIYKYVGEGGMFAATVALSFCVLANTASTDDDRRAADIPIAELLSCILDFAAAEGPKLGITQLGNTYSSLVREGRFRLSVGAGNGIESLIAEAESTGHAANSLRTLSALARLATAAKLLADATSMSLDTALAFSPGLNIVSVKLVGSNPDPAPTDRPTSCEEQVLMIVEDANRGVDSAGVKSLHFERTIVDLVDSYGPLRTDSLGCGSPGGETDDDAEYSALLTHEAGWSIYLHMKQDTNGDWVSAGIYEIGGGQ